jgi:hypothetical protein
MDGSIATFTADPFITVVEVIGRDALVNSRLLLRGEQVNAYMTLDHEKITNGSVLHLFVRAPPSRRRKRSVKQEIADWLISQELEEEEREAGVDLEKARITDLIWSGWEISRRHDRMCTMMQERQTPQERSQVAATPLNLAPATQISAEPLPTWFGSGNAE